ncbi:MAG TPA: hypothetical protein VIL20_26095 [Sandaracinaceae bacterium]
MTFEHAQERRVRPLGHLRDLVGARLGQGPEHELPLTYRPSKPTVWKWTLSLNELSARWMKVRAPTSASSTLARPSMRLARQRCEQVSAPMKASSTSEHSCRS